MSYRDFFMKSVLRTILDEMFFGQNLQTRRIGETLSHQEANGVGKFGGLTRWPAVNVLE